MVELLVVMVIIGLLGGVVLPSINTWISSRTLDQQKKDLSAFLAALPAKAHFSQQSINIDSVEKLNLDIEADISIIKPIAVLSNGYCMGGELSLGLPGNEYIVSVEPPLCAVEIRVKE